MFSVFISFANPDLKRATFVATVLKNANIPIWFSPWNIPKGTEWAIELMKGINQSERMIAIVSASYLESGWTLKEFASFWMDDPTGEKRKIIPVRVDNCSLPRVYRGRQYIDIVNLSDQDAAKELIQGIEGYGASRLDLPVSIDYTDFGGEDRMSFLPPRLRVRGLKPGPIRFSFAPNVAEATVNFISTDSLIVTGPESASGNDTLRYHFGPGESRERTAEVRSKDGKVGNYVLIVTGKDNDNHLLARPRQVIVEVRPPQTMTYAIALVLLLLTVSVGGYFAYIHRKAVMINLGLWPRDYLKDHPEGWFYNFGTDDKGDRHFHCFLPSGRACDNDLPAGWEQKTATQGAGLYINGPGFVGIANLHGEAFYQYRYQLIFYLLKGNRFSWVILPGGTAEKGRLFVLVRNLGASRGSFDVLVYGKDCDHVETCKYDEGQSPDDATLFKGVCGNKFQVDGEITNYGSSLTVHLMTCSDGKTFEVDRRYSPLRFPFSSIGLRGDVDNHTRLEFLGAVPHE